MINKDEQAKFYPDVDYIINSAKCEEACEELQPFFDGRILTHDVYMPWVEKYKTLYESIRNPFESYTKYEKFEQLFNEIEELQQCFENEKKCRRAFKEYLNVDQSKEFALDDWMNKHKLFGNSFFPPFLRGDFQNQSAESFIKIGDEKINIRLEEFEFVIKFKNAFDQAYLKSANVALASNFIHDDHLN